MPSENQGQRGVEREQFPRLQARLNEDPSRYLDHDLGRRPLGKHVPDDGENSRQTTTVVPDEAVSPMRAFVKARIRGIDSLEVIRAWRAVERNLDRDRGPNCDVHAWLDEREAQLEAIGERPDRLQYRDPVESTESVAEWTHTDDGQQSTGGSVGVGGDAP